MKSLGAIAIALTIGAGPAWAADQPSSQPPQQSTSQPQQQTQQQDQMREPLTQAKIEGKVQRVSKDELTLSVAGSEVKLSAEKQQLQGVREGDNVQVTAVPLPEANKVTAFQQATQKDRQKAREQGPKSVMGSIEDIQADVVTVKTPDTGSQRVKVEQKQAQSLQVGQQYIFQLSSAPDEAKEWKAVQVKKM